MRASAKVLSDTTQNPEMRLLQIAPTVRVIDSFALVAETDLRIETMLDAVRLAAVSLLACATVEPALAGTSQQPRNNAIRSDGYDALDALRQ